MKVTNKTNKIIGFGSVTILPGEAKDIPQEYENSPVLEFYKKSNFITVKAANQKTMEELEADKARAEAEVAAERARAEAEAENIRQQRLQSIDGISTEELAKLAEELGISLADCKDQADILKKVKAALKK